MSNLLISGTVCPKCESQDWGWRTEDEYVPQGKRKCYTCGQLFWVSDKPSESSLPMGKMLA
jgi:Zn ribbon nucleic-acid-binding protein